MASVLQEREVIYGSDQEPNSGLTSEKVQGMANAVYAEFKRMMSLYGEDAIKELMPLIVTILEALDRSLTECNENVVEVEMLRDDNEQLVTQFDRERQLRRNAEQQLLETEDNNESAARELRAKAERLETTTRHLELKCKNYTDQVERLQERETDLKKEYSILHDRHTEMIQSYMDHIERTKITQNQHSYTELSPSPNNEKDLLVGNTPSPLESSNIKDFSPDCNQNVISTPVTSVSDILAMPNDRSHLSLKEEIPKSLQPTPTTPSLSKDYSMMDTQQPVDMEVGSPSDESDGQGWVSAEVRDILQNGELDLEQISPKVDMEHSESVLESTGIENAAFDKSQVNNESSLFAELSQQDLGDVDEGADILGMSKEVENLINENNKLLATKNALNVVKDDLIQQVDHLTTQHTLVKEELKMSEKTKVELEEKLKEQEKQLTKLQGELNNVSSGNTENTTSKRSDEEEVLPMSQRKRFTRVEMARVLMERNQYKERLMELQEAVRWTETLRASRAHPDVAQTKSKNKSTIFQFFSRLFTSGNNDSNSTPSTETQGRQMRRSGGSDLGINVSYNVPTSKVMPRSRSTQISLYGRSPTIDALREEPVTKPEAPKREIQTRMVDNRFQACGWSLPNSPATPKDGSRTVPVPVYCGPLLNADSNTKLWCAAAVNIAEGRTKDGGSIVGSGSIFYDKNDGDNGLNAEKINDEEFTSLDKLDEEIETETNKMTLDAKKRNALSSYVWLVAGDSRGSGYAGSNAVTIIDACEPNRCISKFQVGSSDTNILCIASIPGADLEDYMDSDSSHNKSGTSDGNALNVEAKSKFMSECTSNDEVAIEATEDLVSKDVIKKFPQRGVTEHVFTDSNNLHSTSSSDSTNPVASDLPKIGTIQKVQSPVLTSKDFLDENACGDAKSIVDDITKLPSLQPTMWLGAQNGYVYVHSAVHNWQKCLHQIRLKDSVLAIIHTKGRALAALADGSVAFFRRQNDGIWNLSNYHLLDLGKPHHSIRCMAVVYDHVWCAYRNKIHVVEPKSMKIQSSFDAHPRHESQVRQLAWAGDGVWVSIRLDSTVRLYHARTLQHLQDVDVEPYVSKVLGSGKLGFSFVRITSLMISNHRLWIGTGNGVVMSVPLSEGINRSSTLERHKTCLRYQDTIVGCGVKDLRCLICNKMITQSALPSKDQCMCRLEDPESRHKKKTTKLGKRQGKLWKLKFFHRRGAKTSTSTPVLSSFVRDRPGGVIRVYSDPVSEKITPGTFIPYCSMANAQLSFHGYRDAVKFFVAVPGCLTTSPSPSSGSSSKTRSSNEGILVLSGGEGYVDFRKGDLEAFSPDDRKVDSSKTSQSTLQNSHVIMWQLTYS